MAKAYSLQLAEHGDSPALIDYEKRRKSRQTDPHTPLGIAGGLPKNNLKHFLQGVLIQRLARFATLFVVDEGAFDQNTRTSSWPPQTFDHGIA